MNRAARLTLTSIALSVQSTEPWQVTDRVAIEHISLDFLVGDPTQAQTRTLMCDLSGELKVDDRARFRIGTALSSAPGMARC